MPAKNKGKFGICYGYTNHGYYRTQWMTNISAFRPDFAWERGLPPEVPNPEGIISIKNADDLPHDMELIVLSPKTARIIKPTTSLIDFKHPKNAIYFFGTDMVFLSEEELGSRNDYQVVSIPVLSDKESDEIYSFTSCAIVLYDRMVKKWQ